MTEHNSNIGNFAEPMSFQSGGLTSFGLAMDGLVFSAICMFVLAKLLICSKNRSKGPISLGPKREKNQWKVSRFWGLHDYSKLNSEDFKLKINSFVI